MKEEFKIGDKVLIRYGYNLHLAEIIDVFNNQAVEYRFSFSSIRLGFLAKAFGFYMTEVDSLKKFKERIVTNPSSQVEDNNK